MWFGAQRCGAHSLADRICPAHPWLLPNGPLPLAYYAMMIANFWLGWPFMTVVATGALQSIPKDLYEAAAIDGASDAQQFWNITVPLLRPAMIPAAVYGFTMSFNLFAFVYFMTGRRAGAFDRNPGHLCL
jgi:ABC-type sugar transport system permease subunit